MKALFKGFILVLTTLPLLLSCTDGGGISPVEEDDSDAIQSSATDSAVTDSSAADSTTIASSNEKQAGESDSDLAIDGRWQSLCNTDQKSIGEFSFEAGDFTQQITKYADDNCIVPTFFEDTDVEGTYIIGREITTTSGLKAFELDLTIVRDDYSFFFKDIVRNDGVVIYFGEASPDFGVRSTTLDFDELYIRMD